MGSLPSARITACSVRITGLLGALLLGIAQYSPHSAKAVSKNSTVLFIGGASEARSFPCGMKYMPWLGFAVVRQVHNFLDSSPDNPICGLYVFRGQSQHVGESQVHHPIPWISSGRSGALFWRAAPRPIAADWAPVYAPRLIRWPVNICYAYPTLAILSDQAHLIPEP
jgi:hypothetical protein